MGGVDSSIFDTSCSLRGINLRNYDRKRRYLIPVKLAKVTSNDKTNLIYLPSKACDYLGLKKGDNVLLLINPSSQQLILEKVGNLDDALSETGNNRQEPLKSSRGKVLAKDLGENFD